MSEYDNATLKSTEPGKSSRSKIVFFPNRPNWIYRATIIIVFILIIIWLLSLELRLDSEMDAHRKFRLFFDRLGVENLNL